MTKKDDYKILEKYPELSPAELRKKLDEHKDYQEKIDAFIDEAYAYQMKLKTISKKIGRAQLCLKVIIFGGLTKEEFDQLNNLNEELKEDDKS